MSHHYSQPCDRRGTPWLSPDICPRLRWSSSHPAQSRTPGGEIESRCRRCASSRSIPTTGSMLGWPHRSTKPGAEPEPSPKTGWDTNRNPQIVHVDSVSIPDIHHRLLSFHEWVIGSGFKPAFDLWKWRKCYSRLIVLVCVVFLCAKPVNSQIV